MDPAIRIRDLVVRRGGRTVLPGLDLEVPTHQVTGLLGPSGSGKTTLMRAIVGVQVVESGEVTVLGDHAGSARLRHRVAYVTQSPSVYGDLTVRANVGYFARVMGVRDLRVATDDAIRRVELTSHADDPVRELSGGERSRVSLACALVAEPELLVLDEPTVGLDPVLRRDLWALFHELAAAGSTLLVSSHVMDEATRCDRLLLLREGHLVADDTPAGLLRSTGQPDAEAAFLHLVEQQGAA
jgi:ABC-2 type transport system ATP-binding protein